MEYYKQSTSFTSAAAGLMSVINHFDPNYSLTKENEFKIWSHSATLPTKGCSIYGLASYAHPFVDVSLFVEKPEYKFPGYRFKSYKKKEIDIATFHSELKRKQAVDLFIKIAEKDFSFDDIVSLLSEGKVLMVRLIIGILRDSKNNRRNPHYVPVFKHENGFFHVIDSNRGIKKISSELLRKAFEAVHECHRDNRMMVFDKKHH